MSKRLLILSFVAAIAAALAGTALAKPAVLLPGGTYLNQAASTGLSCLGGASGTSGTTTFIVTVPSSQSVQGVTFKVDYTFDPDNAALASFSGTTNVHAQAPSGTGVVQAVPVSIPVQSDDGLQATVVNASVISVASDGTLLFDAASLGSWTCGTAPAATGTGSGSTATGCSGIGQLVTETAGTKGELQHKVRDAQKDCLKGHMKEAAHHLGDFLKELSHQAPKLSTDLVSRWSEMATAIRASLFG